MLRVVQLISDGPCKTKQSIVIHQHVSVGINLISIQLRNRFVWVVEGYTGATGLRVVAV